jgi:DNA-3-methyladenine glycosylase
MFGPPGRLYVYFIYGMHWCANAVCGSEGLGQAVLIRALAPISGLPVMRRRRARAHREVDLCNGPAKLCSALEITGADNGVALHRLRGIRILDDGTLPPALPRTGPRIGIRKSAERPWRWSIDSEPHVSRP